MTKRERNMAMLKTLIKKLLRLRSRGWWPRTDNCNNEFDYYSERKWRFTRDLVNARKLLRAWRKYQE